MADLSVAVVQGFGRRPIMPVASDLYPNPQGVLTNTLRVLDAVTVARTLSALATEALALRANTVSVIDDNPALGEVAFNASPDQASVTTYTARVRVSGNATVVATQSLGVPTPDGNNVIIVDLTATFAGLAAGNYTVSILTTSAGGSTDSAESAPFALPLA